MKAVHFRKLLIWQRSMELVVRVYRLTAVLPRSESFGLIDQMRRAAVSVPSNISEGHGRGSKKSFGLFLRQARGSLNELETQVELCVQLAFAKIDQCSEILREIDEIGRMPTAFESALRKTL
jgi:four helix bundle protein